MMSMPAEASADTGAAADAESKIGELAAEALAAARRLPVSSDLREELVAMTEQMVVRTS